MAPSKTVNDRSWHNEQAVGGGGCVGDGGGGGGGGVGGMEYPNYLPRCIIYSSCILYNCIIDHDGQHLTLDMVSQHC